MRIHGRQHGLGYLLAVVATVAIVLLRRFVVAEIIDPDAPLYLFLFVVVASAWVGGLRAGLAATALCVLAGTYFFSVRDGWLIANTADRWRIVIFILSATAISAFTEWMHRSRDQADRQSEFLRITLASIGDAVITTDAEGRITSLNAVAAALTGWMQDEAAGRPLQDVFHIINEWTRREVEDPVEKVLELGKAVGLANHTLLIAKDGTERPIDDSAAPIQDDEGITHGVVLIFRDITEKKRAERTRLHLASIVESSEDAIIGKDLDGIIRSWNRGAERLYGYTAEEAVGKSISFLIPPDHLNELKEIMDRLKKGERIDHFETVRVRKDRQRLDVSLSISPIKDEDGRIIGASKTARDISPLKRLNQQLQEADRRKDEFLATLAHELRNPLAPLRNALQIIRLAGDNKTAAEKAQTVMERQLQQMVRLIDDLLDVSRITRDKLSLRKERIDLATVVRHAVETSRPLIEAASHEFSVSLPNEPVFVEADEARLAQVFSNLLNNAAKFTESGGHIWLTVEHEGSNAVVRVKDTGIGIPPEHQPLIFKMFSQVDRTLERSQGGLGIGLTLAKRLVEMHGGTIEAHSEGHDKGSEFSVRLPTAHEPPIQPKASACEIANKAEAVQCKVLIVDDNEDAANSMSTILRYMGHDTRIANDGETAVQEAASYLPHVVLLDIALPKISGYEVARLIREEPWSKDMKLVALTGWGQEEDKRRALGAGFDHHMVKPVEPEALEELLHKLCPPRG